MAVSVSVSASASAPAVIEDSKFTAGWVGGGLSEEGWGSEDVVTWRLVEERS